MPSPRKGENPEDFKARVREYMNARNFARTGRQPIRRIRASLPKEHSPVAPTRHHYKTEDWERRLAYREQVGLWPERLRGIEDDTALVTAMRAARRGSASH
jgi:hypothetical protein